MDSWHLSTGTESCELIAKYKPVVTPSPQLLVTSHSGKTNQKSSVEDTAYGFTQSTVARPNKIHQGLMLKGVMKIAMDEHSHGCRLL